MEYIFGLATGLLLNYWAVGILICLSIVFANIDWKFFAGCSYAILLWATYKVFDIGQYNLPWWQVGLGYLLIGIVWSFWRYKKFVRESVQDFNEENKKKSVEEYQIELFKEKMSIKENYPAISYHIVMLPVSVVESALGDLIDLLKDLVTVYLKKVYDYIASAEFAKIDVKVKE